MKLTYFTLPIALFFVSFQMSAQTAAIIDSLRHIESPVDVIFYTDSLLINGNLSDDEKFELLFWQADAYQQNKNYRKALDIYNKILAHYDKNTKKYIKILLLQSNINVELNHISIANEQALEALELAKKNNYNALIAMANNALSHIYYTNKQYDKALQHLIYSEQLQIKENDSAQLSATYNNMAIIYKNKGNFDKALQYNNKSLKINILLDDKLAIGKSLSNIGRLYELSGDYDKALLYYEKAIENNRLANLSNSIPYRNAGDIFIRQKDYKQAEKYFLKALEIERENHNDNTLKKIYDNLLQIAIELQDYKKALYYKTAMDSIQQILLRQENIDKQNILKNQHQLFQNKKRLEQEQEINKKNKLIFAVSMALGILLLLIILLRYRYKTLYYEQERLQLEQQVLRSQMNPHFIFNVLAAIQNSLLNNDPITSASYLSRFAKLIRKNFEFSGKRKIKLADEIDALQNYLETQKLRFDNSFDYEINIYDDVYIDEIEIPPLLLQPLVENAIVHGIKNRKNAKISVHIFRRNNQVCFEVKDNGTGFQKKPEDGKIHALDILKKRLYLLNKKNNNLIINTSDKGTSIKFCIDQ